MKHKLLINKAWFLLLAFIMQLFVIQNSFSFAQIENSNSSNSDKRTSNIDLLKNDLPKLLGISNIGNDYWFTIPPAFQLDFNSTDKVKIFVTSSEPSIVTVEVPNRKIIKSAVPYDITDFELNPEEAQIYTKTGSTSDVGELVQVKGGIHVYSNKPILVYVLVNYRYVTEGFLAIPTSSLGLEYIVSSYGDASANYPMYSSLPSLSGIVVVFDNTRVSFTMSKKGNTGTAGGLMPGETVTKTLNKGDVWMFSSGGKGGDLSGSIIKADKPVAVVSGNQCANIPVENSYCDYITEMQLPVHSCGRTYHAASIKDRRYSSVIRIYAKQPNTTVYRSSKFGTDTLGFLNEPGFIETRITKDSLPGTSVFYSNNPIGVTQYNTGVEEDGDPRPKTDPFMMSLVPVEQYQKELTFCVPSFSSGSNLMENYINIIYEADIDGLPYPDLEIATVLNGPIYWKKVKFESTPLPVQIFAYDVNGKKYGSKVLSFPYKGVFKLRSTRPFATYCYGFSNYGSYGYPASASLSNLEKKDNMPPVPTWKMLCDGTVEGVVTDFPNDENYRSNLSNIFIDSDSLVNYKFASGNLIPGISTSTTWGLKIIEKGKDACAVLTFYDMAGNDTTIVITYSALKLAITPDFKEIGKLRRNEQKIEQFKISNLSDKATARISKLQLKSGNQGFDIFGLTLPFDLRPKTDTSFMVSFSNSENGFYSDSIGVGDTCVFYYSSLLRAEVGEPEIVVSDVQFGDITIGQKINQTVTIQNSGKSNLLITGYSGPRNSVYKPNFGTLTNVSPSNPYVIKPDDPPFTFLVTYEPTSEQIFPDTITFFSNANRIDSLAIISGRGISSGLAGNSCDFGRCRINRNKFPTGPYSLPNPPYGIKLENNGTRDVYINGYQILRSTFGEAFQIDSAKFLNLTIPAGQNIVVPAYFQPKEAGRHELVIRYYNDAGSQTETILLGTGVISRLKTEIVDFGITYLGDVNSISEKKIKFTCLPSEEWEFCDTVNIFDFIPLPDSNAISSDWNNFSINGFKFNYGQLIFPVKLSPGESIYIQGSFFAQESGDFIADLITESDAGSEASSHWIGKGIAQGIWVRGDSANILFGESKVLHCTIQNYGLNDIHIDSLSFEPNSGDYSFVYPAFSQAFDITAGAIMAVDVICKPIANGDRSTLLIAYNSLPNMNNSYDTLKCTSILYQRYVSVNPVSQTVKAGYKVQATISLEPGTDISRSKVTQFDVKIKYNSKFLKIIPEEIKLGKLISGIFDNPVNIKFDPGVISFTIKSIAGDILNGSGELLKFTFESFLPPDSDEVSVIEPSITPIGTSSVNFTSLNGRIAVKHICQNDNSKIIFSNTSYNLMQINPNPISSQGAEIKFSVGLKGWTQLSIYNSYGQLITNLVNSEMSSGEYTAKLPIEELPSGVYWCRMKSGPFEKTVEFVVYK